jgi:AcrR family transcriptional regulator
VLAAARSLFGRNGYAQTSVDEIAEAARVTKGAVYHHFASKQALFEAVLDQQEERAMAEIRAAAVADDPWEAAVLALAAYLNRSCDPVYGRLVWVEGPAALGWHRWRECEKTYSYGLVEGFVTDLVGAGYLDGTAFESLVQFSFWMLGGAGLAVAEAAPEDKPRVRDEWGRLIAQAITAQRLK